MPLKLLKGVTRWAWLLLAFLVIGYAVLILTGRQVLPVLDQWRPQINDYLSKQLSLRLETESLGGHWARLTPALRVSGVAIYSEHAADKSPAITIDKVIAEIDPIESLMQGGLVWRELQMGQVSFTLTENAAGRWLLGGIPFSNGGGDGLNSILDILFYSDYISIDRIAVNLHFYSGTQTQVYGRRILVENSDDFHRVVARLALADDAADSAELVLEGRGDPGDYDNFDGWGYLKLNRINFSGSLSAIAQVWFPDLVTRIGDIETDLDGEFWFESLKQGSASLKGRLSAAEVPLNWISDAASLKNLRAQVTGWFRPGDTWGIRLQGLDADWNGEAIEPLDVQFSQGVGARWGQFTLAASRLNLATLQRLLLKTGVAEGQMAERLATLNPRGTLYSLQLGIDLADEQPVIDFRANMADVAVDPWKGAPGSRGIKGYVQASAYQGFVELDSPEGFALLYPQAYDDYMLHGATRGRVNWRWAPELSAVRVVSGPILIDGEEGQGRAHLYLHLPINHGRGEPEMYLQVGARNSHSRYRNRYIPKVINPELSHWLDQAIGDAIVEEVGFIWRGSLIKAHHAGRTIQLYAKFRDGHLDYFEGWPELTNLAGEIVLDDNSLDGAITQATLVSPKTPRPQLETGTVTLRPGRQKGEPYQLHIDADVSSQAAAAMAVLYQSPLRQRVSRLEGWTVTGQTRTHLDLRIPLSNSLSGGDYRIASVLSEGRLISPAKALVFEGLSGKLQYTSAKGLFADDIQGELAGNLLTGRVETRGDTIHILADGKAGVTLLPLQKTPMLKDRVGGQAPLRAELVLPVAANATEVQLSLQSNLRGLALDLPAPYGKTAEQAMMFQVDVRLRGQQAWINGGLGEQLSGSLIIEDGELARGIVNLDKATGALPEKGLLLSGELAQFNLDEWQWLLAGDAPPFLGKVDIGLQVYIGRLQVKKFILNEVSLAGNLHNLQVSSPTLAGNIQIPVSAQDRLRLGLDYLKLPTPDLDTEDSYLDNIDPRQLPAVDFAVKQLSIGERELGSLSFLSETVEQGVRVSEITATITGVGIGGGEAESAELQWQFDGSSHHTHFSGVLQSSDLAMVLESWNMPKVLDSQQASLFADLSWADKPWAPNRALLNGYLGLDFQDGHFYQTSEGPANALIKVVGLFNFDTWLRRLQFDFSDLFSKGVSYDKLTGGLVFENGLMRFDEPVVSDMPSGKIRLQGQADLLNEELNATLVATLPVGTNLPWLAALAGGLPAAAGVYITGKLFEKQVNQLSSISYSVTGPWEDPKLQVQRIFSDKTQKKAEPKETKPEKTEKNNLNDNSANKK